MSTPDSVPTQENITNPELIRANECLQQLREILPEDEQSDVPAVAWSYGEYGECILTPISNDLAMSWVMSDNTDAELLFGELNELQMAEEKRCRFPEKLQPLTPEINAGLRELFAPFTDEVISALNQPDMTRENPLRDVYQKIFWLLQARIMELFRTSQLRLQSIQNDPSVQEVLQRYETIRSAIGQEVAGKFTHNRLPSPYLSLIIED
jgi:hypothetical protein